MGRSTFLKKAIEVGVVTKRYPYTVVEVPDGFRGRPIIDGDKCIGCCACTAVCPPNALSAYEDDGYRIIRIFYGRCIFCGRCADVCPENAISLTKEFELTTDDPNDLNYIIKLKMVKCIICGRYFDTERHLKKVIENMKEMGLEIDTDILMRCPEHRNLNNASLIGLRREFK